MIPLRSPLIHSFRFLIIPAFSLWAVVSAFPVLAKRAPSDAEREARFIEVRDGVQRTVKELEGKLTASDAMPVLRDLPNAALAKLLLDHNINEAEELVQRAFALQNMDAKSPKFGSIPWQVGHPEIVDDNSIEFCVQALGPIWYLYGDRLSNQFKEEMLPHIRAAFAAIRRHNVPVGYTNMFLMKAVNLILLGEAVQDPTASSEGYAQFDQWLDYTRQNGIHEFDSPTYYGIDLNSLFLGYRFCAKEDAKAKFKAALDYFWTDIAANLFPARGALTGPHSRDYDFLRGGGSIDVYLFIEGLRRDLNTDRLDLEKAFILLNDGENGYRPSAKILSLARKMDRIVQQKWDTGPDRDKTTYITDGFAMGSANGNYGAQDKPISIQLMSDKDLPDISIVPDTTDQPYGKLRIKGSDGHMKPVHQPLHPTIVQEKGALLVLLDLDPSKAGTVESFATNLILPAKADQLTLDGKICSGLEEFSQGARKDSVVGVREGNTGVAIRLFKLDGCAGKEAVAALKADRNGLKYGAARLALYHHRGAPTALKDAHIRVGLLIVAAPCADEAAFKDLLKRVGAARIEEKGAKGSWEVAARIGDLTLEAGRDLDHRTTLYRRVNGQDVKSPVFSINGEDESTLLAQTTAAR
jgi:hypothetical protein